MTAPITVAQTIAQLPTAIALTGEEYVPISQNGQTVKATSEQFIASLIPGVTSVTVNSVDGILSEVDTPTTTPVINLSLGAITPSSVNGLTIDTSGAVLVVPSNATVSGINTGNVTLSGENYLNLSGQAIAAVAVDLSGTNATGILAAARFPALSGDVSTALGSLTTTLATVNSNVGSFTNANITVNAKGLVTSVSSGSGGGIITTISIASANGFSGSSSGGTSPILTLNTTITGILQGDGNAVSAASTTGSGHVVLATSPTITTPVLNGTPSGTGVATAATANTLALRDTNANISANNFLEGYTTTVTAAGTTSLTVSSTGQQFFTGTTTQIVALPVASTLVLGQSYLIANLSTGLLTIHSSGGATVTTLSQNASAVITCILTSGTTASSWSVVSATLPAGADGTVLVGSGGTSSNFSTGPTLGVAGSSLGTLSLSGVTSGVITITPQFSAGTYSFTLPNSAGTAGQVLTSGGSGAMTWSNSGGSVDAGTSGQLAFYNFSGTEISGATNANLANGDLTLGNVGTTVGSVIFSGNTSGTLRLRCPAVAGTSSLVVLPAGVIDFSTTGGTSQVVQQTSLGGTFSVGQLAASNLSNGTSGSGAVALVGGSPTFTGTPNIAAATGISLSVSGVFSTGTNGGTNGQITFNGSTSGSCVVRTAVVAGTGTIFQLPSSNGSNGQFLQTNGSGVTTWATVSGSGTVNSGTSGQLAYYASSTNAVSGNADANISNGALTLGVASSVLGSLILSGSTSGTTTINPNVTASGTLTLPAATDTLVGRATTDTLTNKTLTTPVLNGTPSGTGVATAATANTLALRDTNANISANNFLEGYTTTVTAAGTTSLTVSSTGQQFFTGTTTQIVALPVASTLVLGQSYEIFNQSTGTVTVNSSGGNAVIILASGTYALLTCILTSGTTAASWAANYYGDIVASGKNLNVSNSLTLAGTDGTTMTFPSSSGTVTTIAATQTLTSKTLDNSNTVTLKDANFTLQDDGDTTKQLVFQLSTITTGTTCTVTIPGTTALTLVGTTNTQTLTNKVLGNTNTLTTKDTLFTLQDDGDTTKQLQFQLSGITTANTRTLTVPDASTTIVGTDATQTLTNKTIVGGSNTISGITEAMQSLSNVTTANVSTSAHGYTPILPNDATKFFTGTGTYVNPFKAWGTFNGVTTVTVLASFNIASITRSSAGKYAVTFTNAMTDANYAIGVMSSRASATGSGVSMSFDLVSVPTTSGFSMVNENFAAGAEDTDHCTFIIIGN